MNVSAPAKHRLSNVRPLRAGDAASHDASVIPGVVARALESGTVTHGARGRDRCFAGKFAQRAVSELHGRASFILMLRVVVVIGTLLSDMLLAWLDPRIRYQQG